MCDDCEWTVDETVMNRDDFTFSLFGTHCKYVSMVRNIRESSKKRDSHMGLDSFFAIFQ
jgi:hypothetical protein